MNNYLKISALFSVLSLTIGCAKDEIFDESDLTPYEWKKETVLGDRMFLANNNGNGYLWSSRDGSVNVDFSVIQSNNVVKVEYVRLTNKEKNKEEQRIKSESAGYLYYRFTKIK